MVRLLGVSGPKRSHRLFDARIFEIIGVEALVGIEGIIRDDPFSPADLHLRF
jgi:hypothetical protein